MGTRLQNRDSHLRRTFGISHTQYETLAAEQEHQCFICLKTDDFSDHLAVDHCHKTGVIRGLLCRNCNRALGQFQDRIDFLERAIVYLKREPPTLGDPEDQAPAKPHNERARWFCRVSTPDGEFKSYKEAGAHYGVHPTTIRDWCLSETRRKPGFKFEKEFGI